MYFLGDTDDDIILTKSPDLCPKPATSSSDKIPIINNDDKIFILEGHINSPVGKWSVEKLTAAENLSYKDIKSKESSVKRLLFSENTETHEIFIGNLLFYEVNITTVLVN